jgi:bifunctional non-homologous end joining protein LigD
VEVSNAGRVVYPEDGFTKGDVVDHYRGVAGRMLRYISGRALTVERFPKGIGEKGFMQKNIPQHAPPDLIGRHEVDREEGGVTVYPVVDSEEGILFFANLGVITFHAPPSTLDRMDHPDWLIWDLDPPEGEAGQVRRAAYALRDVLDSFGIPTLPMTSGSKGYHLRTPITPGVSADVASGVARGTAALAEAAHPDLMTLAFRKADRGDRVFVDWLRNTPLSTSVVPWSLRARPGAPVATPLTWDDVAKVSPDGVHLPEAANRGVPSVWEDPQSFDIAAVRDEVEKMVEEAGIELEPFDRFRS